ncbi:MAG: hypothetical protein QW566_02485 [Candidatus Jordarchaeales archaeon]
MYEKERSLLKHFRSIPTKREIILELARRGVDERSIRYFVGTEERWYIRKVLRREGLRQ